MASLDRRLPGNVPGALFVDSTCIDCDTCRLLDPAVYRAEGGQSVVHAQPAGVAAWERACKALVSCPTASIGVRAPAGAEGDALREGLARARAAFPDPVDAEVAFCGWTSAESYGAWSWLLRRPGGNVLVDSPRFSEPLARAIEAQGGARWMFLTHRDDVADHARWAARLGAERVMHADDAGAGERAMERLLTGDAPVRLADDLLVIPTPGHTRGHAVLLHADRHLFTGDHLAWDSGEQRLVAFRSVCWYDWGRQTDSMVRLLDYTFRWVLPGHGERVELAPDLMRTRVMECIDRMSMVK